MEALQRSSNTSKYPILVIAIVLINLIMLLPVSSQVGVLIMWGMTIVCIVYSGLNVFNPLTWFTVVFSLYYSAYALLILVYNQSLSYGLTVESLRYSILALSTVVVICGIPSYEKFYSRSNFEQLNTDTIDKREYFILEKSLIIGMFLGFVLTVVVSRSFVSKSMATKSGLFGVCTYLIRALTFLCGVYILGANDEKKCKRFVVLACGVLCAAFAFLNAERDCILRYMLVLFITLYLKKKIHKRHIIIFVPLGMGLMVLINSLKYFFIDRSVRTFSGGLIQSFLSSDFGAPGGNLQNLVNHSMAGQAGYGTIFTDVVRGIFPVIKVGTNYNTWYNNYFFHGSSYSRAFTLVGEGYLIDGAIGIVVLFVVVAVLITILTKRVHHSIWSTMAYVYGIITIISCFRGTLIDIVTGLVRTPLIAILIFVLFQAFYNRGKVRIRF